MSANVHRLEESSVSADRRPPPPQRHPPNPRAPSPIRKAVPPLVLVADDNNRVRGAVASILGHIGYRVAVAADGEQALRLARGLEPSLLVLDVNMPGLDGLEVVRRVRESETIGRTPIVVMSAYEVKRNLEAGAAAYLLKPFRVQELLDSLAALLPRST